MAIQFHEVELILMNEAALCTELTNHPSVRVYLAGLALARELMIARSDKEYAGFQPVVLTALLVKVINDTLAANLLIRGGYTLQSFPLFRSALETAEIMEHLRDHEEDVAGYIRGSGKFKGLTTWLRTHLPETSARRKAYEFFNYLTHPNWKGMDVYVRQKSEEGVSYVEAGAQYAPHPALMPFSYSCALLAYAVRIIWEADPGVVGDEWAGRFKTFDAQTDEIFARADVEQEQRDNSD
jgi:hypothetical protein